MNANLSTETQIGGSLHPVVRRWRSSRPHYGGWEWMEGGRGRVETVLLVPDGSEVVSDDEWEQATGKPAEHDGWVENYWEGTATDQNYMPGLWRQAPPNPSSATPGQET